MEKEKLYKVAKEYIGTPWVNGGNVKGAGLDCSTLPSNFFHDLGYGEFYLPHGYPGDWFCRKDCKELILDGLEQYCIRIDAPEPGDIISYRWGRSVCAHLSIYMGDNHVLHCSAIRGVEITDYDNPYFYDAKGNSRITGFWRVMKQ